MSDDLRTTYLNGIKEATDAAQAYYIDGKDSVLTDAQYDLLVAQLSRLGDANGWTEHVQLVDKVAAGVAVDPSEEVTHRQRMLSLDKAQNEEELAKFLKKTGTLDLLIEPKLDGLAIVATYKDGKLVQVATRGDSRKGQNVTRRAKQATIQGLPSNIAYAGELEVRGELFMTNSNFEKAQSYRAKHKRPPYKNPRNAVSGAIQSKDDTRLEGLVLTFSVYDFIPYSGAETEENSYTVQLNHAQKLGFIPASSLIPELDADSITKKVEEFGKVRATLNYPTDGVVVKVDSISLRKKLGNSERHPYWAIAYKYESVINETRFLGVIRNVGRTGAISYTARLEPTEFADSVVQKATLNNARFIQALDLRIGDVVFIRKANEIIPEILGVNFLARGNKTLPKYEAPTTCPICKKPLDTTSSIIWRCLTPECTQEANIVYAVSRDNLDIKELSESRIHRLFVEGFIKDVTDLYGLSVQKLASLPTGTTNKDGSAAVLGEKIAQTLYTNIQKSKQQPLNRVLSSLGVRYLGRTFGRRFSQHFKTFDAVVNATIEQMQQVEGVKDKALIIRKGLDDKKTLISKYQAVSLGAVKVVSKPVSSSSGNLLTGQSVVITGAVPGYSRNEAKELIEDNGGNSGSSVSSRTTLLVAPLDERETSKAKKAQQLGIRIITPEEFLALLGK